MKKLFVFFVCVICAFVFVGCETTVKVDNNDNTQQNNENNQGENNQGENNQGENNQGENNQGENQTNEIDRELDAKYQGLAKDKKVYLTTIGQADVDKVQSFFDDLDLVDGKDYTKKNNLTAAEVEAGSVVFLVIGTSGKGLGAAGTNLNAEKDRANAFVAKEGITLIVFHVGGLERRGDTTDPIIDIVCPKADLLLVVNSGNDDNKFTNIAKANNVDLYLYSKTSKMRGAVTKLLGE